ncbi:MULTISPECIES: response regulator [unclassified Caballeronia]|uniref:response regulator n=1 Tax=unclassified Caballeronia TaxID=2646786 RepID=UPI00202815C3|nr:MULTISPECIES: response regulator [unclassified Caballeronia]
MKKTEIAPFFFPTTVAFVDDSTSFLQNLSLQLDEKLAFRLFDSPGKALEAINAQMNHGKEIGPFLSRYGEEHCGAHEMIAMRLDAIHAQINDSTRFERISAVVVDYDMPGMNGLDFCRQIKNRSIKKIVLTGIADEQVAVKSFNEGLIDCFLRKQDPEVVQVLGRVVHDMQRAYFEEAWRTLADTLEIAEFKFLRDPNFAIQIQGLFKTLGIVEHYLCSRPDGLIMYDSQGVASRLIVYTESTLRALREIAIEQAAPTEFIRAIDSRQRLPYFPNSDGNYHPGFEPWQIFMHPAMSAEGEDSYLFSAVERIESEHATIRPFDDYLDFIDQQSEWKQ